MLFLVFKVPSAVVVMEVPAVLDIKYLGLKSIGLKC